MKLLPASVDPVDPSQLSAGSTSLVPLAHRSMTTSAGGEISLVPSADSFAWSSSTRQSSPNYIDATPVEDPQSDSIALANSEYVSGWAWSSPAQRTAIAQYLFYATGPANSNGRLVNLYA